MSDNRGLDILVNGSSTGQTNSGAHTSLPGALPANAFSIGAADGLQAGLNLIEFEWGNGPAGGANSQYPNPTHVRIEFTSATSTAVPAPPAFALLASALGVLGVRRRPRLRR